MPDLLIICALKFDLLNPGSESKNGCQDIDECVSSPCNIHAQCSNSIGSFDCKCTNGTVGDGLEHRISKKKVF